MWVISIEPASYGGMPLTEWSWGGVTGNWPIERARGWFTFRYRGLSRITEN